MSDGELTVEFSVARAPTLAAFMGSDAFARVVVGPMGSGKTSCCLFEYLRRAVEMPRDRHGKRRSRWVAVRNTYRELEDTTIKSFEECQEGALSKLGRWRMGDNAWEARFNDVEMEIIFRALDRPDHVRKLLSMQVTGAFFNELREIPKIIFDHMQPRCGRFPARSDMRTPENPAGTFWHGVWGDTNPTDTDHWIYKLFEEERPQAKFEVEDTETGDVQVVERSFERFKQPGGRTSRAENVHNLPPGYYQTLMLGKDEDWIRVNVDGEWGFVREGKPVFPEYRDAIHCVEGIQALPTAAIAIGMDFGLTPACVLGQRDPKDQQLQVFDEVVAEDMGAVRFANDLARRLRRDHPRRGVRGYGDPAGAQRSQVDERTPFDVVNAAGVPMAPAPSNDFMLRREAVAGLLLRLTMLGRPALVISPNCRVLRKALQGGYAFPRKKISGVTAHYHENPEKNEFSHVADALQYLCLGEGEGRQAVTRAGGERLTFRYRVKHARSKLLRGPDS